MRRATDGGQRRLESHPTRLGFLSRAPLLVVGGERIYDALALGEQAPEGCAGAGEVRAIFRRAYVADGVFLVRDHGFETREKLAVLFERFVGPDRLLPVVVMDHVLH